LTDDPSKQSDFLYLSPQRYRDIHYTYIYLETNNSAYRLVRNFGDVTVYESRQPFEAGEKKKRWARTVAAQRGQGVNTLLSAAAYSAFGHLHGQAENWEEAKVQYGKAVHLSKDDILSRYDYALALAHQDSFDLACKHIDQISSHISDPADPWLKLGWDLYVMGVFERSRKASLTAHAHQPTHPFALYNVALTYLAEGKASEADSAYTVALQNNALPAETETLLGKMIADGSLQGESLAVANRVLDKGSR
jgi:tetratricopeptide (TPR) repeat protein